MKNLILFRHGKSDWLADYTLDHDRPLAIRGKKAAKKMGIYLSKRNESPDLVISSTALRAKTTAEIAMSMGKWNCNILFEPKIYGCNTQTLLNIIKKQDDTILSLCLVGHEPSFSIFTSETLDCKYLHFPTATMAKIKFNISKWSLISFKKAKFDWLIRPKELK